MSQVEILVALVVVVGLVGIVLPILPGSALIVGAFLVWAISEGTGTAWAVFAVAVTVVAVGAVVKYLLPGRSLRTAGVPTSSIVAGGLLAIVGFFVVPVIGLVLGFLLGVYLAEVRRLGRGDAWPSTVFAMKAVGLSILIELAAALLATAVWLTATLTL